MVLRFDMVYDGLICFMMVWYNYINVLLEPWRQHTPVDGVYVEYIYIYMMIINHIDMKFVKCGKPKHPHSPDAVSIHGCSLHLHVILHVLANRFY